MKKELNIENVIEILNNQETFNSYSSNYYIGLVRSLIDYFYNEPTKIEFVKETPIFGGYCNFSSEFLSKECYNIKRIQFESLYPSIIVNLYKEGKIKFNVIEFGELYTFLVENKKVIKSNNKLTNNSQTVLNIVLNGLYGLSSNSLYKFGIDKGCLITDFAYKMNEYIFETFKDDIIYIDTDTIYLKEINNSLSTYLSNLPLKYKIEDNINFCVFRKKTFVCEDSNGIRVSGMMKNKSRSYSSQYGNDAESFVNKLKMLQRRKKIEKILNGKQRIIEFV